MDQRRWYERRWLPLILTALVLLLAGVGTVMLEAGLTPFLVLLLVLIVLGGVVLLLAVRMKGQHDRILSRETQYRLLTEHASDVVVQVALDGTLEWISPSVTRLLGYEPAQLIGTDLWVLIHPDDRAAAAASLADAATPGHPPLPLATRFCKSDGSYVWLSAAARKTPEGLFVVSFREVDEEVRARQALLDSEVRYRLLAENAMDLVFSLDMHAVITWVSPSAVRMLGYGPEELIGQFGGMLIVEEDLPLLLSAAADARTGLPVSCQIRMLMKSGDERWVEATPRALHDDAGDLVGGVIGVREAHEEVLARTALVHASDYDALTGLANPALALARIQGVLDTHEPEAWALVCVGVDGMTAINQAYTYAAGDAVLAAVAARLVTAVEDETSVARIAGDEFVVLVDGISDATDAASAAAQLLSVVRGTVDYGGVQIDVSASAGIALAHGGDVQGLLRDSTAAMRQASAKGPDHWEFLDGDVAEQARRALSLQSSLREAVRQGRIEPWFMPIVGLTDGAVVGYEVLARWIRGDGRIALPAEFLAVAERTGLIVDIDRAMLERSVALLGESQGIERLAVNVSAATLANGSLTALVVDALQKSDVDARRLHLEVTETSLVKVTKQVRRTMEEIAGLGASWWVDDFGTGFSSISHLRDLPISGLKLDQSFTAGVTRPDTAAARLALGLVGLASGLGLQTIAEGIENAQQAEVLTAQGWQMGQGWLFGRPIATTASAA